MDRKRFASGVRSMWRMSTHNHLGCMRGQELTPNTHGSATFSAQGWIGKERAGFQTIKHR